MPIDPWRGPPVLPEPVRQLIGQVPFVGPLYNALRAGNQIVKSIQGWTGNLPASQALPGNDPDYNNPNYIGLGDPVGTVDNSPPTGPMTPERYRQAAAAQAPTPSMSRGAFAPTLAQNMFPGSAIGPLGGGIAQPYGAPGTRGAAGLGTPFSVTTEVPSGVQSWMNDIRSRAQK